METAGIRGKDCPKQAAEYYSGALFQNQSAIPSNNKPYFTEVDGAEASPYSCKNSLADITLYAFTHQQPLTITPDVIWMTLVEGVLLHIKQNPTHSRKFYGKRTNRKTLVLQATSWESMADDFTQTILNEVKDPGLINLIVQPFSTTTPEDRVVFSLAAMSSKKGSFNFTCTSCGIPSITLEGTQEDWEDIKKRISYFRNYHLDAWVEALIPIIDHFILTAQDLGDKTFWRRMVRHISKDEMNEGTINGWLINLYPLVVQNTELIPNPNFVIGDLTVPETYLQHKPISTETLPYSTSTTNIVVGGQNLLMISGILGAAVKKYPFEPHTSWLALPVSPTKEQSLPKGLILYSSRTMSTSSILADIVSRVPSIKQIMNPPPSHNDPEDELHPLLNKVKRKGASCCNIM